MNLTDTQIARVFKLCDEIAAVKSQLPPSPPRFDCSLQIAESMRISLSQHAPALRELARLAEAMDPPVKTSPSEKTE